MQLGILRLELAIEQAFSLKDKRSVLKRLRERIKKRFNVSIAEIEDQDVWNFATLAIVIVSNEQRFNNQVLDKVVDHVEQFHDCEIDDISMEFIKL